MYFSLRNNLENFTLWILCMDEDTYNLLNQMQLPNIKLIALKDFETDDLKKVKKERTIAEYCWTCAAPLNLYLLEKEKVDMITYLDADIYFYSDIKPVFDEIGDSSIAIIEHRFSQDRAYMEKTAGRFNVEWVSFKNDTYGFEAAKWWKDKVIEWCYNRFEDGKMGDQLYLNDWPERFKKVCIIKYKGAGLAPWNLGNYKINFKNNAIYIDDKKLIFYHFHGMHQISKNLFRKALGYHISKKIKNLIYTPYFKQLQRNINFVLNYDKNFNYGFIHVPLKEIILDKIMEYKSLSNFIVCLVKVKNKLLSKK